jgi:hypothetical protein
MIVKGDVKGDVTALWPVAQAINTNAGRAGDAANIVPGWCCVAANMT